MSCGPCREKVTHSKIKVEEKGKSATFLNPGHRDFIKKRVDGCVLKNTTAADFVVTALGEGSVIVELKGVDVDHAVEQVHATAVSLKECGSSNALGPFAGLVVCARYPRFDTKVQSLMQKFAKAHRAPLHIVTRNEEYELVRVLAFDGPR